MARIEKTNYYFTNVNLTAPLRQGQGYFSPPFSQMLLWNTDKLEGVRSPNRLIEALQTGVHILILSFREK